MADIQVGGSIDQFLDRVLLSDAVEFLRCLPDQSVDVVFVDPAYQLPVNPSTVEGNGLWGVDKCIGGFSEQKGLRELPRYDKGLHGQRAYQAWCEEWAREAFRVLKPGGMMLAFCSTKSIHRLTVGVEDAGFDIRDQWAYAYAKGMPTGQRELSKDVEKVNGLTAKLWEGWKNIVRPAYEPICVARKPLEGSIGENAEKWGNVGGFNIGEKLIEGGRQISNIVLMINDLFDSYSKFFFNAKASKEDRSVDGLYRFSDDVPRHIQHWMKNHVGRPFFTEEERKLTKPEWTVPLSNDHPTVKNTAACQEILSRVAKPGAVVVDFFAGSGSILVAAKRHGCRYIGCDNDPNSVVVSQARLFLDDK